MDKYKILRIFLIILGIMLSIITITLWSNTLWNEPLDILRA